jgi:Ca2+-binding RTX toxin-like protein
MGLFGGKKKSSGRAEQAENVIDIVRGVADVSEGMENNDRAQQAKGLIDILLTIASMATLTGKAGGMDDAKDSLHNMVDTLNNRQKYIDEQSGFSDPDGSPDPTKGGSGVGGDKDLTDPTQRGRGASRGPGAGGAGSAVRGSTIPRRDPLVLDLDGDGIETTSPRDGTVILFDHDADGIKTGTGWVKPDDGWLVWDRNGNGVIDSGRELFGVDTLKSSGQTAVDGFDALRELDTNEDGKVNAADTNFSKLRIWRDLNQDAISQEAELSTLATNGIVSIQTGITAVNTDLGNGNVQTAAGTFTRTNGSTGATGETNSAAANLDLLVNTFYRQFTDPVPLTAQALALPELMGSGQVRDLSEAISLSPALATIVDNYTKQTTRQGQLDLLDTFIAAWADTSTLKPLKEQAEALAGDGVQLTYGLANLNPGTAEHDAFMHKLGVVERFMGFTYGGPNGQARLTTLNTSSGHLSVSLANEQIFSITQAYDRFKMDIYESLLTRTRLASYVTAIAQGISWDDETSWIDSTQFEKLVDAKLAANPREGIIDLIEFVSASGTENFKDINWNMTEYISEKVRSMQNQISFSEELSAWTANIATQMNSTIPGSSRADLIITGTGNDSITGSLGDDYLDGGEGDDSISDYSGFNTLIGGAGNDTLKGHGLFNGGTGNDLMVIEPWANPYTNSGDTYLINFGDGQDTISEYGHPNQTQYPNSQDIVRFGAGISPDSITVSRTGNDLILQLNAFDRLTIAHWFESSYYYIEEFQFDNGTKWTPSTLTSRTIGVSGSSGNDSIDGWSGRDSITGMAGNDTLNGNDSNDVLLGGDGQDSLDGGQGDDTLDGGNGDDQIYDYSGFNTLTGGAGNDTLRGHGLFSGGTGNDLMLIDQWADPYTNSGDTYLINFGDGQDTISEYGHPNQTQYPNSQDIVRFGPGISPDSITVSRTGNDLILQLNAFDRLTVARWFESSYYYIEEFQFDNGTKWTVDTIYKTYIQSTGTSGNDTLTGWDGRDRLLAPGRQRHPARPGWRRQPRRRKRRRLDDRWPWQRHLCHRRRRRCGRRVRQRGHRRNPGRLRLDTGGQPRESHADRQDRHQWHRQRCGQSPHRQCRNQPARRSGWQ